MNPKCANSQSEKKKITRKKTQVKLTSLSSQKNK